MKIKSWFQLWNQRHQFRINLHQERGIVWARVVRTSPHAWSLRFPKRDAIAQILDGLVWSQARPVAASPPPSLNDWNDQSGSQSAYCDNWIVEFVLKIKNHDWTERSGGDTKFSYSFEICFASRSNVILSVKCATGTISAALTAAENGILFSTLHTPSAAESVNIVDVFEGSKQKQVLVQLAAVLKAVISQQLCQWKMAVLWRRSLINTRPLPIYPREQNCADWISYSNAPKKE